MLHFSEPFTFRPIFLATCIALTVGLSACQETGTSPQQPTQDSSLITPDANLQQQLQVAEIQTMPISDTLRVAGHIDFDENALARIGASVTGRITQIHASLGQEVHKGDLLAQLNSSELTNLQLSYLKARSQMELNKRNVERAQALFKADVIGAAELQRRETEYDIAAAETRAARDQLRVLGVSPSAIDKLGASGTIDSVSGVNASLHGIVVERNIAPGQVVQPSDVLFVVANLARVWAVAQVPEQQISQVKMGQAVKIEVPALANEKLLGKLIYVGQTVNPETRTVLVRTELDNRDGRLKPAMLASMLIEASPMQRLVVPSSAAVRENDEDHVFVAQDGGSYKLVKVKLGAENNGQRVVLEGLKTGDKIVVQGAFHLNNERNRKEMEGGA